MKILFFVLLSLPVFAQDSTYTLPLKTARLAIRDAARSYVQDSILSLYEGRVFSLEMQASKSHALNSLAIEQLQSVINNTEANLQDERKISDMWKREYQKSEKKRKQGSTLLKIGIGGALVAGFLIGNGL